jgi:GNAT superfamily N-acetyltransferase
MRLDPHAIAVQRAALLNELRFALYTHVPPEASQELGLDARRLGRVACFLARLIDDPYYSLAEGVGILEPATPELLNEIINVFDPAGVPYSLPLAPGFQPEALPDWLMARGFVPSFGVAVFSRDLRLPRFAPNSIRIERVGKSEAGTFARINAEAFGGGSSSLWYASMIGQSGFHGYIAYDGDAPVGTGMLGVVGSLGWLAAGATLPEARGRGVQTAMLSRRIRDAETFGCHWLTVETREPPDASFRNVERAGFELAYVQPYFVRVP